jgi:3-dehydroquinate dehydratase-2
MNNKIIIINGPNLNLLGEREQSQYGSTTFNQLKENCLKEANKIGIELEFAQSNIEGELVNLIQDARKNLME